MTLNISNLRIGNNKIQCPQCSHTRKNKRDKCLSVDITNGLYNCHNCGWSGSVQKFSSKPDYIKPLGTNIQLNKRVLNWFEQRKITESTLSNTVKSSSSFYEEKGLNVSLCCGDGPNDEIMSICFLVP